LRKVGDAEGIDAAREVAHKAAVDLVLLPSVIPKGPPHEKDVAGRPRP
jgi:hypothetical protein